MDSSRGISAIIIRSIGFAWSHNKNIFSLLIVLNMIAGSAVYLQFSSFSSVVDSILAVREGRLTVDSIIASSLILGLSFLIPTLLNNLTGFLRTKFRLYLSAQIELYKIEKQSELDISVLESPAYQNLLRAAQEWGINSMLTLQDFIFTSTTSLAGIATSIIILWSLHYYLVIFALVAAAPVYFFHRRYSENVFKIRNSYLEDHRIIRDRISHFEQLPKAIELIMLGLRSYFKKQIKDRLDTYNNNILNAEKKKNISYSLLSLWYLIFLFAAIALMTREALTGTMAVGALLLAFNTYTRFYQTVNAYIESASWAGESARYAGRWFDLFDLAPTITSRQNAITIPTDSPPTIEFKNVSFRYPSINAGNPFVLKNISFIINSKERVAIVGVNGAGKSTLIKLICRIYDPTEGLILVNGVDLREIDLIHWQQMLGVLFQDFPMYNMSIEESISIGRIDEPIERERLDRAASLSGADDFIDDYKQLIWKEFRDGIDLSKGQHQRLAVARMFYRDAIITILDEPTAAIDAITEEKIFSALEDHMKNNTVILITHRFGSVKRADQILMLENGHLIEMGNHEDLLGLDEKYARLYTTQANRFVKS